MKKNMKNLKKTVLSFCLLCSTASKAEIWQTSNAPKTDVILGTDLKISTRLGRFEPFVIARIHAMPIKKTYVVYDMEYDQGLGVFSPVTTFTTYNSPRTTVSLGGGTDFRFTDRFKLTAGIDLGSIGDVSATTPKVYASLKYKFDLSPNANAHAYVGIFGEERVRYLYDDEPGIYSGYDRTGAELGLKYEHRLSNRLSFNAKIGYSYGRLSIGVREEYRHMYPILAPKGEFLATVGLHYRFRPEFPEFERREKMPRTSPTRTNRNQPRHRQTNVPCPAHKQNYRSSSNVFNRP